MTLRLGIFASHGGSNLQAVLDACSRRAIDAEVAVVVGNNSRAHAFQRARDAGVPTAHLSSVTHPDPDMLDAAVLDVLTGHGVELVALAGYMKRLGPRTIAAYRNRIINIHPALLPRHGGQGFYGDKVHRAVIESGDTESGATVHLVNEHYDDGAVLAQARVPVLAGDTPESLAARVLQEEHRLYPETIGRIASGSLVLPE